MDIPRALELLEAQQAKLAKRAAKQAVRQGPDSGTAVDSRASSKPARRNRGTDKAAGKARKAQPGAVGKRSSSDSSTPDMASNTPAASKGGRQDAASDAKRSRTRKAASSSTEGITASKAKAVGRPRKTSGKAAVKADKRTKAAADSLDTSAAAAEQTQPAKKRGRPRKTAD